MAYYVSYKALTIKHRYIYKTLKYIIYHLTNNWRA